MTRGAAPSGACRRGARALALIDSSAHLGYFALAGLMGAESAGVPPPGETALIAAVVLAHSGELRIELVIPDRRPRSDRRRQHRLSDRPPARPRAVAPARPVSRSPRGVLRARRALLRATRTHGSSSAASPPCCESRLPGWRARTGCVGRSSPSGMRSALLPGRAWSGCLPTSSGRLWSASSRSSASPAPSRARRCFTSSCPAPPRGRRSDRGLSRDPSSSFATLRAGGDASGNRATELCAHSTRPAAGAGAPGRVARPGLLHRARCRRCRRNRRAAHCRDPLSTGSPRSYFLCRPATGLPCSTCLQ